MQKGATVTWTEPSVSRDYSSSPPVFVPPIISIILRAISFFNLRYFFYFSNAYFNNENLKSQVKEN